MLSPEGAKGPTAIRAAERKPGKNRRRKRATTDLTLIAFKIMLRLFAKMSGLEINYQKSTFVHLNMSTHNIQKAGAILGCTQTDLPVTYLGMPLTIKQPDHSLFIPLIEKMEKKLQGWKGR